MKQQCKCGNWVEGKPIASVGRKITRGLVKKGMSCGPAAIGAEIGTMIAPGLGSVLGGLAGLAYGAVCEDGIKEVSDAVEDKIFNNDKIEYEFCCPNCGRKWKDTQATSEAANLGNENDDSEEEGQEAFSKLFNWCAENTEQAYNNFEELETVCTDQMMETSSNTVRSEYYYLLAWIKLEGLIAKCFYNESGDGIDYEGIEQGRKYIKLAIDIFGEDEEYCLLKYIFDLWDIDDYDEGLQVILDFEEDSINYNNALLKNEYLLSLWQENAKQYLKNQVIFNADYDDDDTDEAELWFGRIKELVRLFDFAKNDDPLSSPYYDLWEYMTDDLAARYAGGDGCVADQDEALRLANMTAENGDYMGLLWLADVYMDTEDKYVDFDRAKELLQRVLDEETEGCFYHNMAKERWAKLQADTSNGFLYSTTFTESEAEYIETLKDILSDGEISDRERRLLEKLRNKLGISTERAAELEASLTSPQLTEEEQEYLNEYREIIADGEISPRERKLLDKIRRMNGISEDRAKELEAMA